MFEYCAGHKFLIKEQYLHLQNIYIENSLKTGGHQAKIYFKFVHLWFLSRVINEKSKEFIKCSFL